MKKTYDVILIGSGSIGTPTAFYLAQKGFRVLVLDRQPSVGQGSNKSAIGGIRATHTDPSKIKLCQTSLDVFSSWEEQYGDDIEWVRGGYCFVAYSDEIKAVLQTTLDVQKQNHAVIEWLTAKELLGFIPHLNPKQLEGGTYSPQDGSASPLKAASAFSNQARKYGAVFQFNEIVTGFITDKGVIQGVVTDRDTYCSPLVVNCAGAWSNHINKTGQSYLPIIPGAHEAGVTEPVAPFLQPMLVDMRSIDDTSNFYFYQHKTGQIIFCSTPASELTGFDTRETSSFLPTAAKRILSLIPGLAQVRVRRTWRGLYPMTPDGLPLIGWDRQLQGLFIATGMCGQGFMLGPGVGQLIARTFSNTASPEDDHILAALSPYRPFTSIESLK